LHDFIQAWCGCGDHTWCAPVTAANRQVIHLFCISAFCLGRTCVLSAAFLGVFWFLFRCSGIIEWDGCTQTVSTMTFAVMMMIWRLGSIRYARATNVAHHCARAIHYASAGARCHAVAHAPSGWDWSWMVTAVTIASLTTIP